MSMTFTEEQVREYCKRTGTPIPAEIRKLNELARDNTRRLKYGNQKTEHDGRIFDSKHEAEVYDDLMLRVKAGELLGVYCQHPFRLPGDVVYIADFVTLNPDGTYTVIDAKSAATSKDKTYRIKKKLMKNCLGIEIKEV